MKEEIKLLAEKFSHDLEKKIQARRLEMKEDDLSHHLIYSVLGISKHEGMKIDLYQNTGRFLYRTAGSFLEEATILCFKNRYPEGESNVRIANSLSSSPKKFQIDFFNKDFNDAIEIKWRDATTDGNHIVKEHTRAKAIKNLGYKPIRVMFYYPLREQAIKVQNVLRDLYSTIGGEYYSGNDAWKFVLEYSGIDLKAILLSIAKEKDNPNE